MANGVVLFELFTLLYAKLFFKNKIIEVKENVTISEV
jgi:hypothetical protein